MTRAQASQTHESYAKVQPKFKGILAKIPAGLQSCAMTAANEMLDQQFFEMRWRCLSLAADLDRIQRASPETRTLMRDDARLTKLRQAIQVLLSDSGNRAEQVQ